MVGDPYELIEYEIVGDDVIDFFNLESGIHRFKRKSENTKISIGNNYYVGVHARPIVNKIRRQNVENDLGKIL